jgi:hypothetical protein
MNERTLISKQLRKLTSLGRTHYSLLTDAEADIETGNEKYPYIKINIEEKNERTRMEHKESSDDKRMMILEENQGSLECS